MFTGKPGLGQTEEHTYNVCECSGGFLNLQEEEVAQLPAAVSCLTGRSGFAASPVAGFETRWLLGPCYMSAS